MVLPSSVGLIGRSHRRSAVGVLWVELDWLLLIFPLLENGCRTRKGKWEEIWGNSGFLATAAIQIAPLQLNPSTCQIDTLPTVFCRSNLFSLYKHTKVHWEGANENRGVLSMNMCVIDSPKLSTEHFLLFWGHTVQHHLKIDPDSLSVVAYRLYMWTFAVFDSLPVPSTRLFGVTTPPECLFL